MIACVSPPQLSTSHMVQPAASMAQAASTALPPCVKIIAPALAERGLPVIAIQFLACSGGFCVFCAIVERVKREKKNAETIFIKIVLYLKLMQFEVTYSQHHRYFSLCTLYFLCELRDLFWEIKDGHNGHKVYTTNKKIVN